MGQEMRSAKNPLGIEVHPADKFRPRYQASLVRALATAKGGHDQMLLDWADALDQYSRDSGQPGDLVIANMDAPGKSITIAEPVMDKFINELVQQQLSTPLPHLQGRALFDILPDLRKNFRVMNNLSDQWVAAIRNGQSPDTIAFDSSAAKMTHVYGAGQLTLLKLVKMGADPMAANETINDFSDFFGNKSLNDNPHVDTPFTMRLQLAPRHTLTTEIPQIVNRRVANTLRAHEPLVNFAGRHAATISGAGASMFLQDLMDLHQLQQKVLEDGKRI